MTGCRPDVYLLQGRVFEDCSGKSHNNKKLIVSSYSSRGEFVYQEGTTNSDGFFILPYLSNSSTLLKLTIEDHGDLVVNLPAENINLGNITLTGSINLVLRLEDDSLSESDTLFYFLNSASNDYFLEIRDTLTGPFPPGAILDTIHQYRLFQRDMDYISWEKNFSGLSFSFIKGREGQRKKAYSSIIDICTGSLNIFLDTD